MNIKTLDKLGWLKTFGTHDELCDEIDRLRAEVKATRLKTWNESKEIIAKMWDGVDGRGVHRYTFISNAIREMNPPAEWSEE